MYEEATDPEAIIKILQGKIGLSSISSLNPADYCSNAFAVFITHRYRFPVPEVSKFDWWIDVVSFGESKEYYVVATLERPLLLLNDSNNLTTALLKEMFCLDQPAASKVTAYLYRFEPKIFAHVPGTPVPAQDQSFHPRNPFGDIESNETLHEMKSYDLVPTKKRAKVRLPKTSAQYEALMDAENGRVESNAEKVPFVRSTKQYEAVLRAYDNGEI